MYSQRKAVRRFSFLRNPAGIVIGYILILIAVVAGAGAFPLSRIWMALLFVVVGAFFVVAISVIVMAYLFLMCAFFTALRSFARRFCFGSVRMHESQWLSKSSHQQIDLESQATNIDLWDRWIDGVRRCSADGCSYAESHAGAQRYANARLKRQ
jgi:hypothetical protein